MFQKKIYSINYMEKRKENLLETLTIIIYN